MTPRLALLMAACCFGLIPSPALADRGNDALSEDATCLERAEQKLATDQEVMLTIANGERVKGRFLEVVGDGIAIRPSEAGSAEVTRYALDELASIRYQDVRAPKFAGMIIGSSVGVMMGYVAGSVASENDDSEFGAGIAYVYGGAGIGLVAGALWHVIWPGTATLQCDSR